MKNEHLYIFCVIIFVIIFRVLSVMLSFDDHFSRSANVIIFMLSFSLVHILCYHLCYHLMLSFIVIISPLFSFSWKRDTLVTLNSILVHPPPPSLHIILTVIYLCLGTGTQGIRRNREVNCRWIFCGKLKTHRWFTILYPCISESNPHCSPWGSGFSNLP